MTSVGLLLRSSPFQVLVAFRKGHPQLPGSLSEVVERCALRRSQATEVAGEKRMACWKRGDMRESRRSFFWEHSTAVQ